MVWYTGVDKDIYESGIHYRPQQQYLTTDYIWPTADADADAGGGGGSGIPAAANYVNQDQDNYSVYNPDPNRTTLPTSYRPYSRNKALRNYEKFGETVGPNPDLYYPPTNKYVQFAKNLVPMWMKAGIAAAKDILPINRGGIMKNEMLGQGFAIDDIGRVVRQETGWTTGPDGKRTFGAIAATDPRNVMAGYNLTNISEEDIESGNNPFDRRIEKIQGRDIDEALKTKYIDAIEAAKQNWLNAQTNQLAIVKWKQKQKQDKRDKKIRKDLEGTGASLTDQDQITNILTTQQDDKTPDDYTTGKSGGTDAWQETFSGTQDGGGEFAGTGPQQSVSEKAGQSWEDSGFLADGGRVYLNLGGIASVLGTEQDRREGLAPGGPAGGASAGGDYGGNVNPEQEYAGSTFKETYGDGGGGGEEPPTVVENKDIVDVDWLTTKPEVNINLDRSKYLAQLDLLDSLKRQELEGQIGAQIGPLDFTTMIEGGDIGDTNISYGNWSADISPNADINQISYNRNIGDWDLAANYGDGQYGIKFSKSYKHGGLASLL